MVGETVVMMIFIFPLFSNHSCPALGTLDINATLTGLMRHLVAAFGANAVAAGTGAGLCAAAASAASTALSASTAQELITHLFVSFLVSI
jgi:hypothetical protein